MESMKFRRIEILKFTGIRYETPKIICLEKMPFGSLEPQVRDSNSFFGDLVFYFKSVVLTISTCGVIHTLLCLLVFFLNDLCPWTFCLTASLNMVNRLRISILSENCKTIIIYKPVILPREDSMLSWGWLHWKRAWITIYHWKNTPRLQNVCFCYLKYEKAC